MKILSALRPFACVAVLMAGGVPAVAATTTTTVQTTTVHRAHVVTKHAVAVTRDSRGRVVSRTVLKQTTATPAKHARLPPRARAATIVPAGHARHGTKTLAARVPPRPAPKAVVVPVPPPPPAPVAKAVPVVDLNKGTATGLPIPRYAALRSDQVSFRAGPGTRYPIQWVYQRRDLPVKIEREFEVWRLVSVPDGFRGWVHLAMLTGRRGFIVAGDQPQTLRATAADTGEAVAILKPGVVGRLTGCAAGAAWCSVEVKTYRGYLNRAALWGTLPDETVGP